MIDDALIVGGAVLLLIGAWLISPYLTLMIIGAVLMTTGLIRAKRVQK